MRRFTGFVPPAGFGERVIGVWASNQKYLNDIAQSRNLCYKLTHRGVEPILVGAPESAVTH
jgi:hypothetical protein